MSRIFYSGVALFLLAAMAVLPWGFDVAGANPGSCAEPDEPKREPSGLVGPFSEISEAISRETDRVFEPELVRRSPTFKLLAGTHNFALWNELIVRPGDDLSLSIVGLMCIERERTELSFDAAVRCIMLSPRPANPLMGYAAEILNKGTKERKSTDRIAHMIESGAGSDDAVVVLVSALTRENLVACLDALDVDQCAASRLAWIVGAINETSRDDLNEKIKSKFRTALESLAITPGVSRCTYLSFADNHAKNVMECLRLVILDPDVRDIDLIPALRRFGKVFAKEIESWLPAATEKRQAFVRKYISS